jgi:hypothetical protein
MKKLILAAFLIVAFAGTAAAQQTFSATEFNKNLGKNGTLCDTIYSLRVVSDTLTLLNFGGVYPNQKYTVAVKGNKINLDWSTMKGKPLCVTGVFILYKGRPEIEVTEPDRINMNKKEK